jgi:hypothetical protein
MTFVFRQDDWICHYIERRIEDFTLNVTLHRVKREFVRPLA